MTDELDRYLWALEDAKREAADTRPRPLPFGDGYLDQTQPEYHGTTVGLGRHARRGELLCPPCQAWIDELIDAGFAAPLAAS